MGKSFLNIANSTIVQFVTRTDHALNINVRYVCQIVYLRRYSEGENWDVLQT